MLVFNRLGLIPLVIGVLLGEGIKSMLGSKLPTVPLLTMGVTLAAFDLVYRQIVRKDDCSLISPHKGGHICFIPAWLAGIGLLGLGISDMMSRGI